MSAITSTLPPTSRPQEILALLTREEKASLLAGLDDWHLHGIPRLGIPSIRVTDCGHGVTPCGDESRPATCLPTGIGMAATWNAELLERAGAVLGRECRALGCSILLGPKINLHRHPLNGRSFETFSEDPWLAGMLGAALIRGIQSEGVGACVKAMAANNQQRHQEYASSQVDERTLREIYLRAFQIAVEDGRPSAIMTAYNRLNGVYCSESRWLIERIVKTEWAFTGVVVSDWRAVHSAAVFQSGLDLEMPGPGKFFNAASVLHAIDEGLMTEADLDDKAARILGLILRYSADEPDTPDHLLDTSENRRIALEVAEESIVLLKNENSLLPLDLKKLKRLLVVGPNAAEARLGGGGSASVTPLYSISPLDGIREICDGHVDVRYIEGCNLVGTMDTMHGCLSFETSKGLRAEFFNRPTPKGKPDAVWKVPQVDFSWGWASPGPGIHRGSYSVRFRGLITPPVSGVYRIGVFAQEGCTRLALGGKVVIDEWDDSENGNFETKYRTHYQTIECQWTAGVPVEVQLTYGKRAARAGVRLEWEIPGQPDRLARVREEARAADAVVICAGLSNLFEGGTNDRTSIQLPDVQYALIRAVANENSRTIVALNSGGVLALPWANEVPAILQSWYPGQEGGRALAHILFGQINPSGRLPDTIPFRLEDHAAISNYPGDKTSVQYVEGEFIGYRHFDYAGITPHFPFGYGLGYTTFEFSEPWLSSSTINTDGSVFVSVRVTNSGLREGKTVAQLYVETPNSSRPRRALRAFLKVSLEPSESREVVFLIGRRHLEHFSPEIGQWRVSPGRYSISTGDHSRNLRQVDLHVTVSEIQDCQKPPAKPEAA